MPRYCCAPTCKKSGGHKFPTNKDLALKWRIAIKRVDPVTKKLWIPSKSSVVCHSHFVPSDYRPAGLLGERKLLKDDAIPTIFVFKEVSHEPSARELRAQDRDEKKLQTAEESNLVSSDANVKAFYEVGADIEVPTVDCNNNEDHQETESCLPKQTRDQETTCLLSWTVRQPLTIEVLEQNPRAVKFFTGFENYDHFMFFFHCMGPAAKDLDGLSQYKISAENQLLLTMMKLRQATKNYQLMFFFHISEGLVSKIFVKWINFMYFQLKELDIWPSREIIDAYMPLDLKKKIKDTRVILDATEIPIQKPSNVKAQSVTFSWYKNKNTLKTIIGCSPKGAITFVSDSYGGSCSDRQIIERSKLLNEKGVFNSGDSIMADRGIMVQDLFASANVKVNTPTMLRGKSQLEPQEVVHDRRVASKRIHIERIIGLTKTFTILRNELSYSKLGIGDRIIFVCCMLTNFRPSIVSKFA